MKTVQPSTNQNGFSKPLLVFIVLILIVTATAAVYFLWWRPSDNSIKNAQSNVSTLKQSTSVTLPSYLGVLANPGKIDPQIAAMFVREVETYNTALTALENNAALQNSATAGPVFHDTYRKPLTQYGISLTSVATSIGTYGKMLVWCNAMTSSLKNVHSKSDFDMASADCSKTLANADTSAKNAFNDQFFASYKEKAQTLISALGQYYAASKSDKTSANKAVAKASTELINAASVTVDYGFNVPSSDAFNKLTQALNTEKQSFIR
ncbi:MAG TPA: hypothetical protein VMT96_00305 [Candidatus Bathyarchaeia archaeon]|nr:hypothetical protein [Candidatus Bathyarchaeia archaeon]